MKSIVMTDWDEYEILEQVNRGEEAGLRALFERYYKPLCVYALKYVDSYSDAEDLVQELFVKFWELKGNIGFQGSLQSYLFLSLRNNCMRWVKTHKKYQFEVIDNYSDAFEYHLNEEDDENRAKLYEEIEKLPDQCKKVFKAIVFDDLKYKEAAARLNLSVNTVKTHFAIALTQLRSSLYVIVLLLLV